MTALIDALTALGQQIAASTAAGGTNNAAHLQAIDDHLTKLDSEEGADEATIADTTAGLQALLTALRGHRRQTRLRHLRLLRLRRLLPNALARVVPTDLLQTRSRKATEEHMDRIDETRKRKTAA